MYIRMVRKISAIFFLTVILLSQTPLQQVLRIPVLISHFKEHNTFQNGISFIDFIQLHYLGSHPADDDFDSDEQLPFRSRDIIVINGLMLPALILPCHAAIVYMDHHYPVLRQDYLPANYSTKIWQPPKSC